jgi:hypothetical protein
LKLICEQGGDDSHLAIISCLNQNLSQDTKIDAQQFAIISNPGYYDWDEPVENEPLEYLIALPKGEHTLQIKYVTTGEGSLEEKYPGKLIFAIETE